MVVTVTAELAEGMASFMIDQGAPGLMTEDDGEWLRLTAHFAGAPPLAALESFAAEICAIFPGAPPPRIETHPVPESDWAENWKQHFPPIAVGERLFVHPPWIDAVPSNRAGVVIDPGMAFGTGQHASTRGCLILLERALDSRPGAIVADIGAGSGILAIAAAKLGASEVWATDIDPTACRIAADNIRSNDVEAVVHVRASLEDFPSRVDVIVANLLGGLLIELAPVMRERLRPRGVVIGAGLRTDEEASVDAAWRAAGFVPVQRYEEDGWVTLMSRRA